MFPFGTRVLTRNGMIGIIVRQLNNHPPYQYLVATMDGKPHTLFDTDLSLVPGAERWRISDKPGKGFERRKGERRKGERRRADSNRALKSRSDRRVAERRQAERRWIGENPGGRPPAA